MILRNFFLVLYGLGTYISFGLVGQLRLCEVVAIPNLLSTRIRQLYITYAGYRIVLSCLVVFLLSQIISDLINGSDVVDFIRGWSTIIFSLISTTVLLGCIRDNERGPIFYLAATAIGAIVFSEVPIDFDQQLVDTNYFKARLVSFLNPSVLIALYYMYYLRLRPLVPFLMLSYGMLCFFMDARSNGLIYLIAGALIFIKLFFPRLTLRRLATWAVYSIPFWYFGYVVYVNEVLQEGFGGSNSFRQLSMADNPYNPFELLYYGRTDFFALIQAIKDSPIFGHGSWAKDPTGEYTFLRSTGIDSAGESQDLLMSGNSYRFYIKAHSVFLGSWAWSGFVGFIAVASMFFRLFKMAAVIYKRSQSPFLPIIVILSVDMLWAFFFSPLGLLRTSFPFFASIIISEYTKILFPVSQLTLSGKATLRYRRKQE